MSRTGEVPNHRSDAVLLHLPLDDSDKCWEWTWSVNPQGYGEFSYPGDKGAKAHRVIYEDLVGPIPDGYHVHHKCGNRCCVNPTHLRAVTNEEHARFENHVADLNTRKTHCHRGHPLSGANVKVEPWGSRRCLTCAKINRDAMRARMRADLAAGRVTVTHGTSNAYCNYGCRCDLCRDGQRRCWQVAS